MNRSHMPGAAWGPALGFWFRLWQAQIDQSLRIWGVWASALPKPCAAELAAEAEGMRKAATPARPRKGARSKAARAPAAARSDGASLH